MRALYMAEIPKGLAAYEILTQTSFTDAQALKDAWNDAAAHLSGTENLIPGKITENTSGITVEGKSNTGRAVTGSSSNNSG